MDRHLCKALELENKELKKCLKSFEEDVLKKLKEADSPYGYSFELERLKVIKQYFHSYVSKETERILSKE